MIRKLLKTKVIAGVAGIAFLGTTFFTQVNNNILTINGGFEPGISRAILAKIEIFNLIQLDGERALLTITSPGGLGSEMRLIINALDESGVQIDTYVPVEAASAGATTFLAGKERYVKPDATLLFHGAHFGSYLLTQPNLERCLYQLDNGRLMSLIVSMMDKKPIENITIEERKALEIASVLVREVGLSGLRQQLKSLVDNINRANEGQLTVVTEHLSRIDSKYTKDYVKKVFFKDFKEDVIFTGKQLIEMGIAKDIKDRG